MFKRNSTVAKDIRTAFTEKFNEMKMEGSYEEKLFTSTLYLIFSLINKKCEKKNICDIKFENQKTDAGVNVYDSAGAIIKDSEFINKYNEMACNSEHMERFELDYIMIKLKS